MTVPGEAPRPSFAWGPPRQDVREPVAGSCSARGGVGSSGAGPRASWLGGGGVVSAWHWFQTIETITYRRGIVSDPRRLSGWGEQLRSLEQTVAFTLEALVVPCAGRARYRGIGDCPDLLGMDERLGAHPFRNACLL